MNARQILLVVLSAAAILQLAALFAIPPLRAFTLTTLALTVLGIIATVLAIRGASRPTR